jgi:hypothetical protein
MTAPLPIQVLCVAHSTASIDGQQGGEEREYWAAVVKDLNMKGFYIRIVDKEVRREGCRPLQGLVMELTFVCSNDHFQGAA